MGWLTGSFKWLLVKSDSESELFLVLTNLFKSTTVIC